MNESANLTDSEKKKIHRNEVEDIAFNNQINTYLLHNRTATEPIKIGTTPLALIISGAPNEDLIINPKTIAKCMGKPTESTQGHMLSAQLIRKLPKQLRTPLMIFSGSKHNSLVAISNMQDQFKNQIIIAISLSEKNKFHVINRISSVYGKNNITNYLRNQINQGNLIAANKKEANKMLHSAGLQLPLENTFISFDNSIAYTVKNVKYPEKEKEEKIMTEKEMIAQMEAMRAEIEKMKQKFDNLEGQVATINKFIASMTEAQGLEQTMQEIESVTKQLTDCEKATFYCFDNTEGKFFAGGNDYRSWHEEQDHDEIKDAFESGKILSDGKEAVIPLVSANGSSIGVIVAEKENGFRKEDYDNFLPGSQITSTVELALKKESEHQGRITDELTHLKNRQGLNEYLANTVVGNIAADKPVNIIMCDIDHFKNVNDTYGHDAGDIILKNVADKLREYTRSGADCAFRMGGEEMVCIINSDPERAVEIAERLRQAIEETTHSIVQDGKNVELNVTVSMGIHTMDPSEEMTPENARRIFDEEFKNADNAVYEAKETGRNKIVCADEKLYADYLALKAAEIICDGERLPDVQWRIEDCINERDTYSVVDSIRACVENNPNIAEAAEKLIADIERAFPAAEQKKISLISVEQNGETHDFLNSRNDSLYEIMTAAARKNNLKDYNSIGTRIDGIQYAELEQSRNFDFSVSVNIDKGTVRVYEASGIAEADRTGDNTKINSYNIADIRNLISDIKEKTSDIDKQEEMFNAKFGKENSLMTTAENTKQPTFFNKEGFRNIQNKEYIKTDAKTAYAISQEARKQGVEHSVKYDGAKSAVTVDGVKDKTFIDAVRKNFNIPENITPEKSAEAPAYFGQQTDSSHKEATFFNKEGFKNIRNKEYINTDAKTAYAISQEARKQGVEHSVKYDGAKSAVTVDGIKNRSFVDAVKNMSAWADKIQTAAERNKEQQNRNDNGVR